MSQFCYNVEVITCLFENNYKAYLRHVTVDAIVTNKSKILLVKRSSQTHEEPDKYALPGGYLDLNETAQQAVLRELKEETGYQGKVLTLFQVNDNPHRTNVKLQNVNFVFLVVPVEKQLYEDREIKSVHWLKLDALPSENQFAFDHFETIQLYLQYEEKLFSIPIIGK